MAAPWARAISHNGVPYYIKWGPHFDDDDGDDGDGDGDDEYTRGSTAIAMFLRQV